MTPKQGKERIPVIHIGMPKTATKTLQWRLFNNHSEIYYLGRFDGHIFKGYRKYNFCLNRQVCDLMQQIAYGNLYKLDFDACRESLKEFFLKSEKRRAGFGKSPSLKALVRRTVYGDLNNPDFPACKELLAKIMEPAEKQNLLPVWSWESYSTDTLEKRKVRARNLKEVFGEAKIIMTLRKPIALLESAYFQQLKRDNIGARAKRGRPPYYRTIDQWMDENFHGEVLPHLQYPETIQIYAEQFGVENVHVFLFEELIADHDRFFRNISETMEIDAEEGLSLVKANVDNSRWTTHQIQTLKEITSSAVRSLQFRMADKKSRRELIGLGKDGSPVVIGDKDDAGISQ